MPDLLPYSPELDPELKERFNRMVAELKARQIAYSGFVDLRTKKTAHIASTAHHIYQKGGISLQDLQALPAGQDADDNVWYSTSWEWTPAIGMPPWRQTTDAEIWEEARQNALALAKGLGSGYTKGNSISCAYEGYEPNTNERVPNVPEVPISNHVLGKAADLTIDWPALGGDWSEEAREFVASFGLTRPYSPESDTYCIKERWHFQLAQEPPEQEKPPEGQGLSTNAENVRLVDDPIHWDEEAFIRRRLPKATSVELVTEGEGMPFNDTAPEYQWWKVRAVGVEGWVMQTFLDR